MRIRSFNSEDYCPPIEWFNSASRRKVVAGTERSSGRSQTPRRDVEYSTEASNEFPVPTSVFSFDFVRGRIQGDDLTEPNPHFVRTSTPRVRNCMAFSLLVVLESRDRRVSDWYLDGFLRGSDKLEKTMLNYKRAHYS